MSIDRITSDIKSLDPRLLNGPEKTQLGDKVKGGGDAKGFGQILIDAVREIDTMQLEADNKIEGVLTGKGKYSPHSAMIAIEKADVAFQLMNTVRTKIVRAYEEIMRTQI